MVTRKFSFPFIELVFLFIFVSPLFGSQVDLIADTILYNGKIITVDKDFSIADSVAIKDGRFIAVGTKGEVMRFAKPGKGKHGKGKHKDNGTQMINLKGKTVIPGLMDSHNHIMSSGVSLSLVQLKDCKTVNDVLMTIGEAASSSATGEWIITSGAWHESQLAEQRLPNRWELDSVAPNNPVYIARGGHTVVVNSLAFELAGVDKNTPDPAGGEFKRDPVTGELTGLLFDAAKSYFTPLLPVTTYQDKVDGMRAIMAEYNRLGITSIWNGGTAPDSDDFKVFMELWRHREITVRLGIMLRTRTPEAIQSLQFADGFGDNWLRIAGLKFGVDGGVETAWLYDPYLIVPGEQENPNYYGVNTFPIATLKACLLVAAEKGWSVSVHSVGDRAIDEVVRTYIEVEEETGVSIRDLRWSVMHCFLPTPWALQMMVEHGIWATVQDHATYLGINQVRYWGEERGSYAKPTRDLLDAGIMVGAGTDSPVVPHDPWLALSWFVTRMTPTAGLLGPDQKITRREALYAYTMGSAHFTFEENIKGSIEPGKLADLVVLDTDFLSCPEEQIKNIKPLKTMVGGNFVFEAE